MNRDELKQKMLEGIDRVVRDKLSDASTPGAVVEFDPEEAERAGAFHDDAMSAEDAAEAEEGAARPAPDFARPVAANDYRAED